MPTLTRPLRLESEIPVLPAEPKRAKKAASGLWSGAILARGYRVVPAILLWGQSRLGLTASELNVLLLLLLSHDWADSNHPKVSKQTIEERLGKDTQQDFGRLTKKGFIKRSKRYKYQYSYDLSGLVGKLEAMATELEIVQEAKSLDPTLSETSQFPDRDASSKNFSRELWSDAILSRGYGIIPSILLWGQAALGLTANELNVLLQLISHHWVEADGSNPSSQTIEHRIGKDLRTVQRHLAALKNKGFIKRPKHFKHQYHYDLGGLIEKLKSIAPDFGKITMDK